MLAQFHYREKITPQIIKILGRATPPTNSKMHPKYLNEVVNNKVIDILDHSLIQDNKWFSTKQPSTENLVIFIWKQISSEILLPAKLFCIKLRETGTIFTEYYGEEVD